MNCAESKISELVDGNQELDISMKAAQQSHLNLQNTYRLSNSLYKLSESALRASKDENIDLGKVIKDKDMQLTEAVAESNLIK